MALDAPEISIEDLSLELDAPQVSADKLTLEWEGSRLSVDTENADVDLGKIGLKLNEVTIEADLQTDLEEVIQSLKDTVRQLS